VTATEALGLHDDIGESIWPMMRRDEVSAASGTAKYFIEHEEDSVSRENLTHGGK
jgi:hypothetical protein